MKRVVALLCLLLSTVLCAQNPFTAKTTFRGLNELPLTVHPTNLLQTLQAELNGVPCTLLFDTGASHTTFDRGFIEKHFPTLKQYAIQVNADTNVKTQPTVVGIASLTLGKAELTDFYAMTLPLEHLGIKVDGILGMNSMAYAPFILDIGAQKVTWQPKGTSLPDGAVALPTLQVGSETIRVVAQIGDETLPVLIDSGSSYTFFPKGLWHEAEEGVTVAMQTSDVNAAAQQSFTKGAPCEMKVGDYTWKVTPLLSPNPGLLLGADELKKVKLFIDADKKQIGVLP